MTQPDLNALPRTGSDWKGVLAILMLGAALATVPFWIRSAGLYECLGVEILIWVIYAMGYNLALGYTGLPSFGHGAFLGVGAYGMALYQLAGDGRSLWLGLLVACVAAAAAAGLVGLFAANRRGIYFALLTIAFGQVFWFIAVKWHDLTGGEDGLQNLKRLPVDLGIVTWKIHTPRRLYYFVLVVLAGVVLGLWRLIHSPFGRVIQAVRQNEMRMRAIGYNVRVYKWLSLTISGAVAGLAGGLLAMAQWSAYPDEMSLHRSGAVVMMTVLGGGLVSFWGPAAGVLLYFLARDLLDTAPYQIIRDSWLLWYGLMFMLLVMFKPEGLAGIGQDIRRKWRGRKAKPPAPAASG